MKYQDWAGVRYDLRPEDECPNCECGTLENRGATMLICRGECGASFYRETKEILDETRVHRRHSRPAQ